MNKININWTKVLSIGGILLGFGATLLTGAANDKKTEETIQEKVNEALANRK